MTAGLRSGWRSRTWPAPPAPAWLAHAVRRQPVRSVPLGLLASGASAAAPGASKHVGTRAGDRRLGTVSLTPRAPLSTGHIVFASSLKASFFAQVSHASVFCMPLLTTKRFYRPSRQAGNQVFKELQRMPEVEKVSLAGAKAIPAPPTLRRQLDMSDDMGKRKRSTERRRSSCARELWTSTQLCAIILLSEMKKLKSRNNEQSSKPHPQSNLKTNPISTAPYQTDESPYNRDFRINFLSTYLPLVSEQTCL
ncbi:hypothetical protein STEG23_008396, partial [Scotinomys teguina]